MRTLLAPSIMATLLTSTLPDCLHRSVAYTWIADRWNFGQFNHSSIFRRPSNGIPAFVHGSGRMGRRGIGLSSWIHLVHVEMMIRRDVCTFIPDIFILLTFLLLLHLVDLVFSDLFSQSKSYLFGHFWHLEQSIVETAHKTKIFHAIFYPFIILVDEVKASNLLFLSSQSASQKNYIFSKLITVRVSSSRPFFIFLSAAVLAVIEGLPLIYISQGFKLASSMTSNP